MKNKKEKEYLRGKYEFAYFDGRICFGWITLFRAFLTCCASVFGTLVIHRMLLLSADYGYVAALSLAMTVAFVLLFAFFPRTQVVLFTLAAAALVAYTAREQIYEYLVEFWELMLQSDTVVFYDEEFSSLPFILSVGGIMAFLTAFSAEGELRPLAVPMMVIMFSSPAVVVCQARFYPEVMIFAAAIAALYAVEVNYDATAAFVGKIKAPTKKKPLLKKHAQKIGITKIKDDVLKHGNYSSASVAAFLTVVVVVGIIASLIPDGFIIDYRAALKAVQETAQGFAEMISDGFETKGYQGTRSGYLSMENTTSTSIDISESIRNSSGGTTPLLKITTSNYVSELYVRGDIGYEYGNESWESISGLDYNNVITAEQVEAALERDIYADFYLDAPNIFEDLTASDVVEQFNVGGQFILFRQVLANLGYQPDDFVKIQTISLDYLANMKTVFIPFSPYSKDIFSNAGYEWIGDFIAVTSNGALANSSYSGYTIYPSQLSSEEKEWELLFEHIAEKYENYGYDMSYNSFMPLSTDAESPEFDTEYTLYPDGIDSLTYETDRLYYEEYIRKTYLSVPESEKENIIRFIDESGITEDREIEDLHTAYSTAQRICEYFEANYKYSLTVDNSSGDNTYLGNFLFDTKSGHCALYATAMTLALRELGIPARYVTGFSVGGQNYEIEDNGDMSYTVAGEDLHAWVEVYFRDVGWLPFDPTVSSMLEISDESEQSATETDITEDEPSETDATDGTGETPTDTAASGDSNQTPAVTHVSGDGSDVSDSEESSFEIDWDIVARVLIVLLILAAVAGGILGVKKYFEWLERKRKELLEHYQNGDPTETTAEMLLFLLRLLKLAGYPRRVGELPMQYAARIDEKIIIRDGAMSEAMPIFERTSFAKGESIKVEEEERDAVYKYVYGLMRRIFYKEKAVKRLWYSINMFGKRM